MNSEDEDYIAKPEKLPIYRKGKEIFDMVNKIATNFCKIEGLYGYKWPKLSELHYKLFRENFEEAHNAAVDIHATAKCFWELKRLGKI